MWFCELHIIESFTTDMMLEMYIICLLNDNRTLRNMLSEHIENTNLICDSFGYFVRTGIPESVALTAILVLMLKHGMIFESGLVVYPIVLTSLNLSLESF